MDDIERDRLRQSDRLGELGVSIPPFPIVAPEIGQNDDGGCTDADAARGIEAAARRDLAALWPVGFDVIVRQGSVLLVAPLRPLEKLDRIGRHDGRDRMFVDQLRMTVATQQHREVVEPGDNALKLHAVHQEHCDRRLALADGVEKDILKVVRLISHLWPFVIGKLHWLARAPLTGIGV
jgi:hypothetical protein